jgi:adenosylcobinamide-GDP ribazoletransferase
VTGFVGALQFLTRVPVRTATAPDLARSVPWFPVVGALVGVVVGGVAAAGSELTTPLVGAAVAVTAGVLVTGAFHEDGLADTADALVGGTTVERRLEILKDPRHGSYGVAAMLASFTVRVACLASLGPAAALAGAVAAHSTARAAAVVTMVAAPTARATGLGADYTRGLGTRTAVAGGSVGVAVATLATGWWALPIAVAAGVAATVVTHWAVRRVGGITGDVLGAVEQVAECAVLVVVVGLARRHDVWWA